MTLRAHLVVLALLLLTLGCGSSTPSIPDGDLGGGGGGGCTMSLSGPAHGSGPCDNDPAVDGSHTLTSYLEKGARRAHVALTGQRGSYAEAAGAVTPSIMLEFIFDGDPAVATYHASDPGMNLYAVGVDYTRPGSNAFVAWGDSPDKIAFTFALTSVTMTADHADTGERDFVAHGTLDATFQPDTVTAVEPLGLHVAF
jgi:hypothetical protein